MTYEVKTDPLEAAFDAEAPGAGAVERPALSGAKPADGRRAAFVDSYLRQGRELELKSFSAATGPDGGYALPREIDARIDAVLASISPIRAVANVVKVGSAGYRKLVTRNGVASGWASETGARNETATPVFEEIAPPFGELFANPAASQAMLDDAQFDVEAWLADEIATEFARAEGAAFVNGDGANKPKGFLTFPTSAAEDGVRPFNTLQHVITGSDGGFAAVNPEGALIDLVHSLRAPYRQGAVWAMNSQTLSVIRKFKTADGAFLFQPSLAAGTPDTLLGYPVVEAEDMPDIGVDVRAIAFGNFRAGYLIAERSETTVLRDPYSHKPFVHFYAVKRLGGTVADTNAIKVLKFGDS